MAKQLVYPYSDTPIEGVTANEMNIALVNYKADWKKTDERKGQYVLTNLRSPIGNPETIRINQSITNTLYKGSSVEPAARVSTSQQTGVHIYYNANLEVVDTEDPTYHATVPVMASLTYKVPTQSYVTGAEVIKTLERLISALYDSGMHNGERIDGQLRGNLEPSK